MHELAAFAHRTKATTTVLVDKLEAMNLVRRAKSGNDARTKVVVLTERGEALKEDFERISSKLVSMVYAPIGKTGGEKLEKLLNKVLVPPSTLPFLAMPLL